MKTPDKCADMGDIRAEIDRIDKEVIALLGQRFQYVQAAAQFKTSAESVKAPERLKSMLLWCFRSPAAEGGEGLSPDAIEKMYNDLVGYFIKEEDDKVENGGSY